MEGALIVVMHDNYFALPKPKPKPEQGSVSGLWQIILLFQFFKLVSKNQEHVKIRRAFWFNQTISLFPLLLMVLMTE